MRVNQLYQERADCDLVWFGEAVTRDPFMLVGRTPRPGFTLAALTRARVATVSEVPTPWLCLQHDLRLAGIDPAGLDRVTDVTMGDNIAALRAGAVDVVQLFEPLAEELLADGSGHIWYAAASCGPCSYTTFYARRFVLAAKRDEFRRRVEADPRNYIAQPTILLSRAPCISDGSIQSRHVDLRPYILFG